LFTDEIIRQVTLNCAERGHVLLMIRDEINMTVESYRGLYESVIGHGIRKVLLVSANWYGTVRGVETRGEIDNNNYGEKISRPLGGRPGDLNAH